MPPSLPITSRTAPRMIGGWFEGGPEICEPASPVVYLSWEDDLDELKRRLLQHPDYAFAGAPELHRRMGERLRIIDGAGFGPLWTPGARGGIGAPTEFADRVMAQAEADGARLIVVDSLASAFAASEIARPEVRAFASHFDGWGRRVGCAVVIVGAPLAQQCRFLRVDRLAELREVHADLRKDRRRPR